MNFIWKGIGMKKIIPVLALSCCAMFANTLAEIQSQGVLRVGVHAARPPFSKFSEGNFEGFEVELGQALAAAVFGSKGGKVEFISVDLDKRISAVKDNKVDIMFGSFSITPERAKIIDFSMPYFAVNLAVLTNTKSNITHISQLRDLPIGVEKSSTADEYFTKNGYKVNYCGNTTECYRKVKSGDIVGFADNNTAVLAYSVVDMSVEVNIKSVGPTVFIGAGLQKGNKELMDLVNSEFVKLSKEGFFKKSYDNTFEPFYKGKAERKYFLLDDIYSMF